MYGSDGPGGDSGVPGGGSGGPGGDSGGPEGLIRSALGALGATYKDLIRTDGRSVGRSDGRCHFEVVSMFDLEENRGWD